MENLLLRRVCGRANACSVLDRGAQVFDMGEHDICGMPVVLVVLPASHGSDVRGQAGVENDVLFGRMGGHGESANDFEAMAAVELVGDGAKSVMESGKGKGGGGDKA